MDAEEDAAAYMEAQDVAEDVDEDVVDEQPDVHDDDLGDGQQLPEEQVSPQEPERETATEPPPEIGPEPEAEQKEEQVVEETYEYTEGQVKEMRKAFRVFDKVRNDTIPAACLGHVLRALGLNPTERQLRDAERWLGGGLSSLQMGPALRTRGGGAVVRFKEFLIIMGRALKDPVTEQDVVDAFRDLDRSGQGVVERALLHEALTATGERLYPHEAAALLRHADPKKKGVVKYEDFVRRMTALAAEGGDASKKKKKKKKGKRRGKKKGKTKKGRETESLFSLSEGSDSSVILSIGR